MERGRIGGKKKKKEEKKRREKKKRSEKLQLLSRFRGDQAFGFRRSKRQSWSTQRELRVGTKISGFRQTPRGRGFSPTRFNFCLIAVQMEKVLGARNSCAF